jgi:heterodisulfide reductase subunit A-like polyferredoxin
MAELGIANVVARSSFVNQVDEAICSGCEDCIKSCQFDAISMENLLATVDTVRCVGCGVCVLACSTGALRLARRPEEEVLQVPVNPAEWNTQRGAARGF